MEFVDCIKYDPEDNIDFQDLVIEDIKAMRLIHTFKILLIGKLENRDRN